jgi:ubiquinone/menaquinone biosynthesis C-methylase UbiE
MYLVLVHTLLSKKIDEVNYFTTGEPPLKDYQTNKLSFPNFLVVEVNKNRVAVKIMPIEPIGFKYLNIPAKETLKSSFFPVAPIQKFVLNSSEREAVKNSDWIIETLKVKPGMKILDIGAGSGIFTFRFAKALNGTGEVIATEIDPNLIEDMKVRIKEEKYGNVSPVLVSPKGLDPFYKNRSFDIIFASETYQCLLNPEEYFRALRPSLVKEKGRLYLVDLKNNPDFNKIEFDDFNRVIEILKSKGDNFPIFQKLNKSIQNFIKNFHGNFITVGMRKEIIQNFNNMLSDRFLYSELVNYYALNKRLKETDEPLKPLIMILGRPYVGLVKWLVVRLDGRGIFNENKKAIEDIDGEELHQLNWI